jgi:hypothetical protein
MELDDRLLFVVHQPVIAWDFGVMFVGFAIASRPLVEGRAVDFGPPQDGLIFPWFLCIPWLTRPAWSPRRAC